MMKAAHVAEYYTAYLEGSLPQALREEVARHLESCPQCAAELEEMRALVATLRAMPEMPLPADFAAGVQARLANRRRPARSWFLRLPALAGGTLTAVVLALAILYARPYLFAPSSQPEQVAMSDQKSKSPVAGNKSFTGNQPSSPQISSEHAEGEQAPGALQNRLQANEHAIETEVNAKAKTEIANAAKPADLYNSMNSGARSDDQYGSSESRKFEVHSSGDDMTIARTGDESLLGPAKVQPPSPAGPVGAPGAASLPETVDAVAAPGMGGAHDPAMKSATPPEMADAMSTDRTRTVGSVYATDTRASTVGALALRGIVLKGAEAAVTLETTAPAPTDLVIRAIEPAGGEGQGFPLSKDMRTAVFSLPLQRGGSVVEITLKAGRTERAILVLPGRDGPQSSISVHAREESITAVLRRLAVAGQLFVFCPPQFIEDREASLTVSKDAPLSALTDLASARGFRAIKAGNTVTLAPGTGAP